MWGLHGPQINQLHLSEKQCFGCFGYMKISDLGCVQTVFAVAAGRKYSALTALCPVWWVARLYGASRPVWWVSRLYEASRHVGRIARLYGTPGPVGRVARLYGASHHVCGVARLYGAPCHVGRVARLYVDLLRLYAAVLFFVDGAFLFYVRTGGLVIAFLLWDGG